MKVNYEKSMLTFEWGQKRWFFTREAVSVGILLLFYISGLIGISSSLRDAFVLATPLNLLLSLGLILYNHEQWSTKFVVASAIIFLVGYFSEVIGVHTGFIFGSYHYEGSTLGWKLFGVPVILGANWLMLIYASAMVINHFWKSMAIPFKAALSAGLMVALDVLIEPVAMELNFWNWDGNAVPLQNYLGWFGIAYVLQLLMFNSIPQTTNNHVATILYWIQVFFFAFLWLILSF